MPLLSLKHATISFGGPPLADEIDLEIDPRERVCLVGRNGEGKSTLLDVVAGLRPLDDGERILAQGLRVGRLQQALPSAPAGTVQELIATDLGEIGALLTKRWRAENDPVALARVDARIAELEAWDAERQVHRAALLAGLAPDADISPLSGGQLRRLLIATAMVNEPDLLLLDEPTNHLDLPTIQWLERTVQNYQGAVIFTTHDRAFLSQVATRIIELDRGKLTSWPGNYANYLRRREERYAAEEKTHSEFLKKLKDEERWIRQGIRARRTRNEGRVRRLQAMRTERLEHRSRTGRAQFEVQQAERSSRRIIEAKDISFGFGKLPIVRGYSGIVQRGDKIGLVGPNGIGKTTFVRLLLGELSPDQGTIEHGTRLEIAYFDQRRAVLDDDSRVQDAVADGRDSIEFNGQSRHIISYLQDFLFAPDRVRGPVRALSGGERNRLLLARLFAAPSNLLVLDEPTNDLDVETLELLEERLSEYEGTVLVVSHDREFLDNVVTQTMVFQGGGRITEYAGGFADIPETALTTPDEDVRPKASPAPKSAAPTGRKKLSYKEQRELDGLPGEIETLEKRITDLQLKLADPTLYRDQSEEVPMVKQALAQCEKELVAAYDRWSDLDGRASP